MTLQHITSRLTAVLIGTSLIAGCAGTEVGGPAPSVPAMSARHLEMSRAAEARGLAEPFRGVTTDGNVVPGLFSIRATGVSTRPVRTAAEVFLRSLTAEQRERTTFAVDDPEWRKWMNQHFYARQGISFQEMTGKQRRARSSCSALL